MTIDGLTPEIGGPSGAERAPARWTAQVHEKRPVLLAALELAGIAWIMMVLSLGPPALRRTLPVLVVGFIIHALVPQRYQYRIFVLVSMVTIAVAIGLDAGSVVLAIGALVLVLCHLPVGWWVRVGLLGLAAGILAGLRVHATLPAAVWPALTAAFIFRTVVYMQWLRHPTAAPDRWEAMSYFFMLPTASFPLFPIVDYATFIKARRLSANVELHMVGLRWILRGLLHLLAYRLVYQELTVGEIWANQLLDVVQHIVTGFLLYLNVSGQFHIIAGLLYLFGFQLPETNHLYLLADSFADFWRRINIYWKEFMLKLVYYPSFFQLRQRGATQAMIRSTLAVFVGTWILHSYQYFWLQGHVLFSWPDVIFWGVFAVLVVGSALRERARPTAAGPPGTWSLRRGLQVLLTMTVIMVLWSFWVSESAPTWLYMWKMARYATIGDVVLLGSVGIVVTVLLGFSSSLTPLSRPGIGWLNASRGTAGALALLLALALAATAMDRDRLPAAAQTFVAAIRSDGTAKKDQFVRLVGYYNELLGRPADAGARRAGAMEPAFDTLAGWLPREDFLLGAIQSNRTSTFLGKRFTTNQYGFRDREYPMEKPEGTYRIAIIGPSYVMGWGVADGETLDAQLEGLLAGSSEADAHYVEVLNISLPAWSISQEAFAIEALAAPFSPDVVLLSAHPFELAFGAERVRDALARRIPIPDSVLAGLVREAGITEGTSELDARLRLRTVEQRWYDRVVRWASELAAAHQTRVAILAVALPGPSAITSFRPVMRAASRQGVPVLDCLHVFRGIPFAKVAVNAADGHPNAYGHSLLAGCVERELRRRQLLPWDAPPADPSTQP